MAKKSVVDAASRYLGSSTSCVVSIQLNQEDNLFEAGQEISDFSSLFRKLYSMFGRYL